MAVQEPDTCQVADGSLDAVAFAEVLGVRGNLADQFSLGDLNRMDDDDVQEHGRLDDLVLAGRGHRRLQLATTILVHGNQPSCAGPGGVCASPGAFLSGTAGDRRDAWPCLASCYVWTAGKMTETDTDLLRVAHHEAGHAVAGFALGRGFTRVTVVPDSDKESAGSVTVRVLRIAREREHRSPTLRERQQLLDEIVYRFAGAQAECRFRGIELSHVLAEGTAEHDYGLALFFAEGLEPSLKPRTALLNYLEVRAADLVELHWFLIEGLVDELVDRRTLSGSAVYRLLRAMVLSQPEVHEYGLTPGAPLGSFRAAADWVGRSRRGWD